MIGLCPSCIRGHTKMHESNHTLPDYENILDTIQTTDKMLTECLMKIQN